MLRRSILAALALAAAATPALAGVACNTIPDSLLRLRCYDGASLPAAARADQPVAAPASKPGVAVARPNPTAYPADVYRGPIRMPDFAGRDREYAMFRTRLREGIRGGASFAGHLALIQFGCGTGCSVVYVADVRTGQVYPFPLGGEDVQSLDLTFRTTSRLLVAQWEDPEKGRCIGADYLWTGSGFERIGRHDLGSRDTCWDPKN